MRTGEGWKGQAVRAMRPSFWVIVRPHRMRYALLSTVSFAGAMLEAGFLVLITNTALAIVGGEDAVGPVLGRSLSLGGALAAAGALLLARLALGLLGVAASASLAVRTATDLRRRLASAYLHVSWTVQQAEPAGRLQDLLTSFVTQVTAAVGALTAMVTAFLSLAALLIAALVVDPVATLAVIVALIILSSVLAPLRRRIRGRSGIYAASNVEFVNSVAELGSLGLEMQTYGVRDRFASRIEDLTTRHAHAQYGVLTLSGALPQIYIALAYGAFVAGIAAVTQVGTVDLSTVGAVMLLMLRLLSYGQQLQSAAGRLASSLPFLEQIEDTVGRYEGARATGGDAVPASVTPLEMRDVSFAYEGQRDVLSGVTLRIDPGEVVGLIGPSGAGKSTLAQLVLGLRDPSTGTVHVNGTDLREVDRTAWTSRVAFVAQEALLITGTVAENIRFFRDGIDDATLRRAAAQANLLADIDRLPDGFETHLGQRGTQLSGGQRQRLSIARALAGRPQLLVLDEPTSALDMQSEALIRETLAGLRGQVTVILIAHRMSTLEVCDRIIVVEGGRVTAFETPEVLRKRSGFYRNALALSGIS